MTDLGDLDPDIRYQVLGGIDPARRDQAESDLALVDQLERRLSEMTFAHPRGSFTIADLCTQLLEAARRSIVHWHEHETTTTHARPGGTT